MELSESSKNVAEKDVEEVDEEEKIHMMAEPVSRTSMATAETKIITTPEEGPWSGQSSLF